MIAINKLYGVLLDGHRYLEGRYTNVSRQTVSGDISTVCSVLIPKHLNLASQAALAEMCIKCALTDTTLASLIREVDPYNTYTLVAYTGEITEDIKTDDLLNRYKQATIDPLDASGTFVMTINSLMTQVLNSL